MGKHMLLEFLHRSPLSAQDPCSHIPERQSMGHLLPSKHCGRPPNPANTENILAVLLAARFLAVSGSPGLALWSPGGLWVFSRRSLGC